MSSSQPVRSMKSNGKSYETLAFLFLGIILFPLLAIIFVGGFGFVVWMQHLMFGPPGM